jgi:hypothetical protein
MSDDGPRYFVPAAPGFWVLELCGGETTRAPVVAWEVRPIDEDKPGGDYFAVPVTAEWDRDCALAQYVPVLGPDGSVRVAGGPIYDNEANWIEAASAKARADE